MTPERIAELIPEALTGYYGHKCKDFNDNCICCQAWAELSRLTRERDEAYNAGIETAAKAAQRYEPFGPPDDDFCNKRPDEGEIAQVMWSRTQLTVEAIRALKKPATDRQGEK